MGLSMSKALIFDFDGTLIDSQKNIYECFQNTTNLLAPNRLDYSKNILIGPPLRETAIKILGKNNEDKVDQFVKLFIKMHDEDILLKTKPYPNVFEILTKLSNRNIAMAIATNKRKIPTIKLIKHFGWEHFFEVVECHDSSSELRSKEKIVRNIIQNNNKFKNCYFVGDTLNDGFSANINELKFVKACYGYGKNQDWSKIIITKSIYSFSELEKII